jgi:hypothetical protein
MCPSRLWGSAKRIAIGSIATLFFGGLGSAALADRQEWHLSPVGIVGAASVEEGGRAVWSFSGGAGVRAAYGLADFFELGAQAHFTTSPSIVFPQVRIAGQPGDLNSELYTVELALDARLIGDVTISRLFTRVHPLVGARAGGLVRIFTSQMLLDGERQLVLRLDNTTSILPTITGYAGVEYRFARSWLLGLLGTFTYAGPGYYAAAAGVELSWMTYPR